MEIDNGITCPPPPRHHCPNVSSNHPSKFPHSIKQWRGNDNGQFAPVVHLIPPGASRSMGNTALSARGIPSSPLCTYFFHTINVQRAL